MAHERTSKESRLLGWFWLPEHDASRVPGILTWTQEAGAALELIGGLDVAGSPGDSWSPLHEDVIIHGVATDGRKITLWEAQTGNYRAKPSGEWIDQFWGASWVVIGSHLDKPARTPLLAITAVIDNLYYLTMDGRICTPVWTKTIPGVEHPFEEQPDGTALFPWALGVVGGHRAAVSKGTLNGICYRVTTDATRPWLSPATEAFPDLKLNMMTVADRRGRSIEIAVAASVSIEPLDGQVLTADQLLAALAPALNLVRLATFERPGLDALYARTTEDAQLDVLCRSGHPADPEASPGDAVSPVFSLSDVPLQSFLDFWSDCTKTPQARYALNVALGIIGHSPRFVEEGLSQTLAAAEGFHAWCLNHPRRRSLDKRLRALHGELPQPVRDRLGIPVEQWADWGAWARNHVDHAGVDEHRDLTTLQMKHLSDSVALVLYLRMLVGIGVPEPRLLDALTTHSRLARLCAIASHLAFPSQGPQEAPPTP